MFIVSVILKFQEAYKELLDILNRLLHALFLLSKYKADLYYLYDPRYTFSSKLWKHLTTC